VIFSENVLERRGVVDLEGNWFVMKMRRFGHGRLMLRVDETVKDRGMSCVELRDGKVRELLNSKPLLVTRL
jgi:predicted TPR repeat methyltransferase